MWLNSTDGITTYGTDIHFDPDVVNITSATAGDFYLMFEMVHYGVFVRVCGITPDWEDLPPGLKNPSFSYLVDPIMFLTWFKSMKG